MRSTLRWVSVLPAAIAAWIVVDMLGPLPLNILIFVGSLVRLSPVVDFLVSPSQGGEHLLVFASYGGAVLAAWKAAPTGKLWAASGIGVLFLALRFAMTYSALMADDFTTDSPTRFLVGTIAAVGGVAVVLAWVVRRRRQDTLEQTLN